MAKLGVSTFKFTLKLLNVKYYLHEVKVVVERHHFCQKNHEAFDGGYDSFINLLAMGMSAGARFHRFRSLRCTHSNAS